MPAQARLEGKLTLDDAAFTAALTRAESRSKTFSGRVRNAFSDFGLKNESRVSRQFGQLTSGLLSARSASDAVASSLTALEYSSKVPIGVGLGLAAGVVAFERVREQIDATEKAQEHFRETMARPIGLIANLDSGGISKEIDAQKESLEELQKQQSTFTQSLIDTFTKGFGVKVPFLPKREGVFDVQDKRQQEQIDGLNKIDQITKARGESEMKLADAKELGLRFSERDGELAKISADFAAKRAAIRLGGLDAGSTQRLQALTKEEQLAAEAANKKFDIKEREMTAEAFIADLARKGLSTDQQRIQALKEQLSVINEQLAASGTTNEERATLNVSRAQKENEVNQAAFQESRKSGSQRLGEQITATRLQANMQYFQRTSEGTTPDAYKTHPDAYTTHPDAYSISPQGGRAHDWSSFDASFGKHGGMIPDTGPAKGAVGVEDKASQSSQQGVGGSAAIVGKLQEMINIWR